MIHLLATAILVFCISLTPTWGLLDFSNGTEEYQVANDFVYETKDYVYVVQTTPYWTQSSIKFCQICIMDNKTIKFTWDLDGNHSEFKKAVILNTETDVKTEFDIQTQGSVSFPYQIGFNSYDLYCYTGNTVGFVEFDLFEVLLLDVSKNLTEEQEGIK